jgi:hypothetical protein
VSSFSRGSAPMRPTEPEPQGEPKEDTAENKPIEEMRAAGDAPIHDWPDNWHGIDPIYNEVSPIKMIKVKGIPDWLATAIEEMTDPHEDKFRELLVGREARSASTAS